MMIPINWDAKVVEDYRERIIVDANNPILAFKANRDRYTNLPNQGEYAGLPYLGSWHSEDALTWNIFRSLQKFNSLSIITEKLGIGHPQGLLLWTLAPEVDEINAKLQYETGALIRKFDGIFRGQVTEPDVILLGTTGIAVIECKLSEPSKALSHLWEGKVDSVEKRLPIYRREIPNLVKTDNLEEIASIYQLLRMAFYAMKLGTHFRIDPVLVSLSNEKNWDKEIRKLGKSPPELWKVFREEILGKNSPRCESLHWQTICELVKATPLDSLVVHLSTHPCL